MELLLNVKQAASILGCAPDAIRDHPDRYRLTELRTKGKHRRYKLSEVQRDAKRLLTSKIS